MDAKCGPKIDEWTRWIARASKADLRRELTRLYTAHNEDVEGDLACKIMSYDDAHFDAVEMGYPSLTEALEHLDELRASRPSPVVDTGEALREALERAREFIWREGHVDDPNAPVDRCLHCEEVRAIDAVLAAHPKPGDAK